MPNDYITITQFNEFKAEMREFKVEMYDFRDVTTKVVNDLHITVDEMRSEIDEIKKDIAEIKTMLKGVLQLLTVHIEQSEARWSDQRQVNQDTSNRVTDLEAAIS